MTKNMSKLTLGGKTYSARCVCGSYSVLIKELANGDAYLQCRACGRKSEKFGGTMQLYQKVGGFKWEELKPGEKRKVAQKGGKATEAEKADSTLSCMVAKVADEIGMAEAKQAKKDKPKSGPVKTRKQLTTKDVMFLSELRKERERRNDDFSYWDIMETRYEPCPVEMAEAFELYDPTHNETVATVDYHIEDAGQLQCIPVRRVSSGITNTIALTKAESLLIKDDLLACGHESVYIMSHKARKGSNLDKLLEIVDRVDWMRQ